MIITPALAYCLALGPLAIFLLLIGAINLRRRPLVVSGARETIALGIALGGFVIIGPMQLFLPAAAVQNFGWVSWILLLIFYGLLVTFWVLVARPRLVIYNIRPSDLRSILSELALQLDRDSRWAGDSLAIPQLGVQLRVESFVWMSNVSLVANNDLQSFSGWLRLQRALATVFRGVEVRPSSRGVVLVATAVLILTTLVYQAIENTQAVAQGFWQMLER